MPDPSSSLGLGGIRPAGSPNPAFDVAIVRLSRWQIVGHGINGFGTTRGKITPLIRSPGLKHDRVSLGRSRDSQRSVNEKMLTLMVDRIHGTRTHIRAGTVPQQSII